MMVPRKLVDVCSSISLLLVLLLLAACDNGGKLDSVDARSAEASPPADTAPAADMAPLVDTVFPADASPFKYSAPNSGVDLRTYYPAKTTKVLTRRADGVIYGSYLFGPASASFDQLYHKLFDLKQAGQVYVWQKRYGAIEPTCTQTHALLFFGDDMSVTEVGDWYATDRCTPDVAFGYSDSAFQQPDGLAWSGAGGLRTPQSAGSPGFAPAKRLGLGIQRQSQPGAAYKNLGPDGYLAWNETVIKETLATFTPAYGRSSDGYWGAGKGKTYHDVIRVIFYHGTISPGKAEVSCQAKIKSTNPGYTNLYRHQPGYGTYTSEFYLAPGKGIVQETLLYVENGSYWSRPNCTMGLLFDQNQGADSPWISYVDE